LQRRTEGPALAELERKKVRSSLARRKGEGQITLLSGGKEADLHFSREKKEELEKTLTTHLRRRKK